MKDIKLTNIVYQQNQSLVKQHFFLEICIFTPRWHLILPIMVLDARDCSAPILYFSICVFILNTVCYHLISSKASEQSSRNSFLLGLLKQGSSVLLAHFRQTKRYYLFNVQKTIKNRLLECPIKPALMKGGIVFQEFTYEYL